MRIRCISRDSSLCTSTRLHPYYSRVCVILPHIIIVVTVDYPKPVMLLCSDRVTTPIAAAPCHAFIDDWITTRFWENDSLIDNVQWDMQTKHSPATKIKMDSVYIYAMKCKQGKEKVWATWYSSTGVSKKIVPTKLSTPKV
jgi:hypothetical protein